MCSPTDVKSEFCFCHQLAKNITRFFLVVSYILLAISYPLGFVSYLFKCSNGWFISYFSHRPQRAAAWKICKISKHQLVLCFHDWLIYVPWFLFLQRCSDGLFRCYCIFTCGTYELRHSNDMVISIKVAVFDGGGWIVRDYLLEVSVLIVLYAIDVYVVQGTPKT